MRRETPFHINKKTAVVIPAYNEEKLIAKTIKHIPDWVYSIIIVDDASTDKTAEIVDSLKKEDNRILYYRQKENSGVGAAIAEGYKIARMAGCDIAAVMAGDNQMDPDDLETLVYPIVTQIAGYVKGNRLEHPEAVIMPVTRRLGTTLLAKLTCAAAGIPPLNDMQCGYTALDLDYLPQLDIDTLYPSYGYPNDLIFRIAAANIKIIEVIVRPIYRDEVSGLEPKKVILPISKILLKGYINRLKKTPVISNSYKTLETCRNLYKFMLKEK